MCAANPSCKEERRMNEYPLKKKRVRNKIRLSIGRRAFILCNYLLFTLLIILCAYPLW